MPHFSFLRSPVLIGAVALLCCSCGSRVKLHRVRGQVLVAGRPAEGATVVFHPAQESTSPLPRPAAKVESDGSFELATFAKGDGAPVGDYIVAIAWVGAGSRDYRRPGQTSTRLSPQYANPATSPLRAQIKDGSNELPTFSLAK